MPSHPVALALLKAAAALGVQGVAAPSANRFGRVSPTTAQHVQDEFGGDLWVLDGGACALGIESAIVDCTRPQAALLRPGVLPRAELEAVLAQPLGAPDVHSPRASGTLEAHYAPSAKVVLMDGEELLAAGKARSAADQGPVRLAVYSRVVPPAMAGACHRRMPQEAAAVAHELFAVLRELDAAGVSLIWVERPPAAPEWDGVRDRLQRAAAA
jgi:L-threonylcarbamoyladenylate synthase